MKNARWQGSFVKFRNAVMLFFLIPVISCDVVLSIIYAQKTITEMENKIDIAYLRTSMQLEEQFETINNSYDRISQNQYVKRVLLSNIDEMSGREATVAGGQINALITEALKTVSNLNSVGIYSRHNNYLISSKGSKYMNDGGEEWYIRFNERHKSDFIYADDGYITVCHGINIEDNMAGIMIYEIDKERLAESLRLEDYTLDLGLVIKNIDGTELLRYGNAAEADKSDMVHNLNSESLTEVLVAGKGNIISVYKTIALCTLIFLVVGAAAAIVLAFFCSMYLYDSLSNVLSKVDTFEEKDDNNIKIMNNNLLDSISSSDNIEEQLAQSLNALHRAQLSALQMQISPHFVFNVLNFANSTILGITRCDNDAVKIIALLCEIFEFVMSEPKYMTTVAEETDIVEKYIEIERLKTGIDIEADFDIDEELWEMNCPKMFMQPIIENSIMHGLKKEKIKKGKITVSVKKENDCIEFRISDNGKGINQSKLEEIREQLKDSFTDRSKHIGMLNVNQRIKLIYGNEWGMSVDSGSSGTQIVIRIPREQ